MRKEKREKALGNSNCSEKGGIFERSNSADKGSEEGVGRGVLGAGAEIPLQPMVQTMARQDVPVEDCGGADLHLQPVEDRTPEQVDG